MNTLKVKCLNCSTMATFVWRFNNDLTLSCSACNKCNGSYQLIAPTYTNSEVISNKSLLSQPSRGYYDAFYYNEDVNDFFYYQMAHEDLSFPIFYLNKTVPYRLRDRSFTIDEFGLVTFSDLRAYISNYEHFENV